MRIAKLGFIFTLTLILTTSVSWAAQVKAVKGKKVLIDMQSDAFKSGDILKLESQNGKTVGLVKITRVKGTLAEGILKGKAEKGMVAKLKPKKAAKTKSASAEHTSSDDSSSDSTAGNAWGFMLGMNSTSADIKNTNSVTVALKGNGFSAMGFVDYNLMPSINLRVMAGMEQFNVESTDLCGTPATVSCDAKITYLALDAWARYLMSMGTFRPWVGGGFYMMFPMSKSSSALDTASITNTSVFAVGGGVDIAMSGGSIIPIQIEYDLYPSSESVKASAIAVRAGYGFGF